MKEQIRKNENLKKRFDKFEKELKIRLLENKKKLKPLYNKLFKDQE